MLHIVLVAYKTPHTVTCSTTGFLGIVLYPPTNYVMCDYFLARHQAFLTTIDVGIEPTRFTDSEKRNMEKGHENGDTNIG